MPEIHFCELQAHRIGYPGGTPSGRGRPIPVEITVHIRSLSLLLLLFTSPVSGDNITLDMSRGWIRRDWSGCEDPSRMTSNRHALTIETDSSAALYWQVPTSSGPLSIDTEQDWIQSCDRPPRDFAQSVSRGANRSRLLNASDHRFFTWKWNVSNTIDDGQTIDEDGKIQHEGDDFAAKIGISILRKGTNDPREISYVWTRSLPEETVIIHEKKVLFWRFQYHRIVAQSGDTHIGQWVAEARDLYADYKRIYPNEEPGEIVRIYVMSDSDNTTSKVTGTFADLAFSRNRPPGVSPSE